MLLGGVGMKHHHSREMFKRLADASHYPVALLPDAKGMFSGGRGGRESLLGYWGWAVCWVTGAGLALWAVGWVSTAA